MKKLTIILAVAACLLATGIAMAATDKFDVTITRDEVVDGIRYVNANTCSRVCSKSIELEIVVSSRTIRHAVFVGGCPGNTQGVCALLEGKNVADALGRIDGIDCNGRGTSCPDQLARVLKKLKW